MSHVLRVFGDPRAKGSKVAFASRSTGRPMMKESGTKESREKLRAWTSAVADAAGTYAAEHDGQFPIVALPVKVVLSFYIPRPKGHYNRQGQITARFVSFPHIVKPDFDKLARATVDAATGILWVDDALIVDCQVLKRYADPGPPGCEIEIAVVER